MQNHGTLLPLSFKSRQVSMDSITGVDASKNVQGTDVCEVGDPRKK